MNQFFAAQFFITLRINDIINSDTNKLGQRQRQTPISSAFRVKKDFGLKKRVGSKKRVCTKMILVPKKQFGSKKFLVQK